MQLDINLLTYFNGLKIKYIEGQKYCFDPIRKKYLVLTPEELVRQLIVCYLIQEKKYPLNKINVEKGLTVHGMHKRCDILVYDSAFQPFLLVECKSAKVAINNKVFNQIALYNMALKVPYLLVTNGPVSYCSAINFAQKNVEFLDKIPDYRSS